MNQQQHIHCIIDNCHYWAQGNKCHANEILITTDSFGASQPDNIDCNMASQLSPAKANTCMETCCKTYVQKGSNQIKVDSVKKLN
ncbi:MAG: DUF1540 domain-containing protein [Peptococcia bacterium]